MLGGTYMVDDGTNFDENVNYVGQGDENGG